MLYISPQTETIRLLTECQMLVGSDIDNGTIPGTIPSNPIFDEGFVI